MGAQWKQAGREANSNKRGQIVGKIAKEIAVAAKLGDPDPNNNPRLRTAIEAAKKASVTRDTIERAIKKGAGIGDEGVTYELVTYEGFTPHKVPVIVECLTDNRNRTASDIRVLFRKGQLGNAGAVGWMFDRQGIIEATHTDKTLDIESVAIEAGAQNVEPLEKTEVGADMCGARFFTDVTDLSTTTKFLVDAKWTVTMSELGYVAKNPAALTEEQKKEVADFLSAIDDCDDTHRVYAAL